MAVTLTNATFPELEFEALKPRNMTALPRRIFEDKEGERHLLLGTSEHGQLFEGIDIFCGDRYKKITREVFDGED